MTKKSKTKTIAYKGFDKNLCCRGMQYGVRKTYKHDGDVVPCESGFHACPEPIDVFGYYNPGESRFCEVEVSGNVVPQDNKIACDNLKVLRELSIGEFVGISVDHKMKTVLANIVSEGHHATGYQSASSATGYQSSAVVIGIESRSSVDGKESIACGLGIQCKAKAAEGSWIVLAERNNDGEILCVKTAKAGQDIKRDVFYTLVNGEFVEEKQC